MKKDLPKEVQKLLKKAGQYLYEDGESYDIYDLFNNYYNAGYMHQFAVLVLGLKFFMYCIDNNIGSKIYVYGNEKPTKEHIKETKLKEKEYTSKSSFNFTVKNKKQKLEYGLSLYDKDNNLYLVNCDVTWGRFYIERYKNTISIATRYILFNDLENPTEIKYHLIGKKTGKLFKDNDEKIKNALTKQSEVSNYFRDFRIKNNIFAENENIDEKYFNKLLDKMFTSDFLNRKKPLDIKTFRSIQDKNNNTGLLGEVIAAIYEALNNKNSVEFISYNNVSAGYDILCKDKKNNEKYIEVKTTTMNDTDNFNFYISQNEYNKLKENNNAYLYCIKISNKLLENKIAYGSNGKTIIFNEKEYSFDNINDIEQLKEALTNIDDNIQIYIIKNFANKFDLSDYFKPKNNKKYEAYISNININIIKIKSYSKEYSL